MANFIKLLFKGKREVNNTNGDSKSKGDSKNFEILKYDGIRAQQMGRVDYAIKCFVNALEIEADFEVMNYLSQLYIRTDELEKAKELLNRMIEAEPELISSYLILSNVLFMQEAYNEMVVLLEKALSIDNKNSNTHYLLAKVQRKTGNYNLAIKHLDHATAIQKDFAEARLMRAEIYLEQKQYADATADIQQILEINPEEEQALLLCGKLNELTEKVEEAETTYRRIIELNPFYDQAFVYLAQLYNKQEKPEKTIELCNEAIEFNPNSGALYNERGKAKLVTGDKEGAENDRQLAIQMSTEKEQVSEPVQEEKQTNSLGLPFA